MEPFSLFFLSMSIITLFYPVSTRNLIATSCRNFARADPNIDYTFCTASLQAAPTLHGLGSISIRLVLNNITDTRCHIKHLLKRVELNDPYMRRCFNDCFQLYSDAIPDVKQAMGYYKAKRFGDVNVKISSVMDAATTCQDGFMERQGVASPLSKRNRDVFELSAIALSIMNVIQRGQG